jgi:hypothetical protein
VGALREALRPESPSGGSLPRDVILFSTADWDNPHWTNKQHLAVRLGRRGLRVLYVESLGLRRPRANRRDIGRIIRRAYRFLRGPRHVAGGVWLLSPLQIPYAGYAIVRRCNDTLLAIQIRLVRRWLGFGRSMVWLFNPLSWRVARTLRPALTVYQCVDDLGAVPGVVSEVIDQEEQHLLREADAVVVTSEPLLQLKGARARRVLLSENAVDYEHFNTPRRIPEWLDRLPRPRLGYVGALSDYKVDLSLLASLGERNPDWHIVLVGTIGEGDPDTSLTLLRGLPNVHILGPEPYSMVPGVLHGFDVCLLPNRLNRYTTAMFPMKFFEYCASGKPIVGTPLPSLRRYWGSCYLGSDIDGFERAIREALCEDASKAEARKSLAREHDWGQRVERILQFLTAGGAGGGE